METPEYQRLNKVRKFLEFDNFSEFSRKLGRKNAQIFTDIKNGKCHISPSLATEICNLAPVISFDWLVRGSGTMLNLGTTNNAVGNSGNIVQGEDVTVKALSPEDEARYDRLISLLEKEHEERSRLLSIIENLTTK